MATFTGHCAGLRCRLQSGQAPGPQNLNYLQKKIAGPTPSILASVGLGWGQGCTLLARLMLVRGPHSGKGG